MRNKQKFMGQQPAPQAPQQMAVMANGGVNDAVNFAAEDFYKAAQILARCTDNYTKPYGQLPPGVASFVNQQFFRMNAAGQMLDALGYQGITEVLAALHKSAITYINVTMSGWNKVIGDEGEVKKIWDALAAEEQARANPPAEMH